MAAGLCGAPREHDALSIMTVKVLEHRCLMLFYGTCSLSNLEAHDPIPSPQVQLFRQVCADNILNLFYAAQE